MIPPFKIELVGGPDDGAVFCVHGLPHSWAMTRAREGLATLFHKERKEVYWRSDEMNDQGHHLYIHEGYDRSQPCQS